MADIEKLDGQSGSLRVLFVVWEWLEKFVAAFWTGLGWPHAVLAIVILIVFLFKKELQGLIPRITAVGASGVSLSPDVIPSQQPATKDDIKATSGDAEKPGVEFPTLLKITSDSVDEAIRVLGDADAELIFLKVQLSYWKAMYIFENFYSSIFGGQIKILRFLNGFGSIGCSYEKVQELWEEYVRVHIPTIESWGFEAYLKFLFEAGLLDRKGETLVISVLGSEFLIWMTKFRKLDARPM